MEKFKGYFWDRPPVPSVPPVPSNKTSEGFQKGGLPNRILKPPVPFPTQINLKVKTIGPLGDASAASLRGIKHRRVFKKADYQFGF